MPDAARSGEPWTIGKVVSWACADFERRGFDSPRLDAELLLAHVLQVERLRIILDANVDLSPADLAAYRECISRRRRAEPMAYILGAREFYGRSFRVDPRVLVPRPDTETLVEVALRRTRERDLHGHALDLCTGSGCVATTFACERPTWTVTATDISSDALDLARSNAARLGAVWGVRWRLGDLYDALEAGERFDVVTANPPYIPTQDVEGLDPAIRHFEPRIALDGGTDGLSVVRRVVEGARDHLSPGGVLAIEVMVGQAATVEALLSSAGFESVERTLDYGRIERVVSGVHPA